MTTTPPKRSTIAQEAASTSKPADGKAYEVRASNPIGLLLRVQPSGVRTYYVDVSRGKRIRIGRAGVFTLAQAKERANAILRDPKAALPTTRSDITLAEFIADGGDFATHITVRRRRSGEGTLARIKSTWPTLLDKRMSDITGDAVDALRTKKLAAGLSPITVNRDQAALSSAFTHWVKKTPGAVHPLRGMERLEAPDNKRVRFLSAKEWARLRKALEARDAEGRSARERHNVWLAQRGHPTLPPTGRFCDHLTPMVLIALNTGLRRGELFSLTWDAVDFQQRRLTVAAATAKSFKTRHVPMNDEVLQVLQAIVPEDATGLVFRSPKVNKAGETGGRFDNVSKAWAAVVEAAALTDFTWHDLRHTFASWMAMRGVPLYDLQVLMGHGSSVMTSRYAHLQPEHLAKAVANVRPPA